jgi:hypothetical protein
MTKEEIFDRFRHDMEKPKATVKMFLDLIEELVSKPDEMATWKRNVLASFEAADRRMDEMEKLIAGSEK